MIREFKEHVPAKRSHLTQGTRFLQEVDEDTQAAPSLRDRERHRCISRNTVPSLRDGMRQSIGGPIRERLCEVKWVDVG